jgi:hypothetical protein
MKRPGVSPSPEGRHGRFSVLGKCCSMPSTRSLLLMRPRSLFHWDRKRARPEPTSPGVRVVVRRTRDQAFDEVRVDQADASSRELLLVRTSPEAEAR